jgi:hypothetical protein
MKAGNMHTSKVQPKNRQNRACRIELADLGLNLRVEFLLKTESGYLRDAEVTFGGKKPRQNGRKMTSFRGATAARQSWELA